MSSRPNLGTPRSLSASVTRAINWSSFEHRGSKLTAFPTTSWEGPGLEPLRDNDIHVTRKTPNDLGKGPRTLQTLEGSQPNVRDQHRDESSGPGMPPGILPRVLRFEVTVLMVLHRAHLVAPSDQRWDELLDECSLPTIGAPHY